MPNVYEERKMEDFGLLAGLPGADEITLAWHSSSNYARVTLSLFEGKWTVSEQYFQDQMGYWTDRRKQSFSDKGQACDEVLKLLKFLR